MGMDVFGKNPRSERGTYFRNNIWWWHPLWSFCEQVASDLIPRTNDGHSNGGWGLGEKKSQALAARLEGLLEDGSVARYARSRTEALAAMPDEPCPTCAGTGRRKPVPDTGAGSLHCNGCGGKGTARPWAANHPFDEENVREFAAFLRDCGGFKIC